MQASAPSCSGATKNRTYGARILATGNYPSASTAGPLSPPAAPLLTYYSASKLAVIGLVQAAANELAPTSITVNAVNPGYVRTLDAGAGTGLGGRTP